MKNTNEVLSYIRKNRETEAMIYLKENDRKAAQKLLCMFHATDYNYKVISGTTDLEEVKNCDVLIIASASVLTRDEKEYRKIEKELKKNGIKIEVAGSDGKAGEYINMMIQLQRKGRI